MSKQVIIKKPKRNQIGIIPINKTLLSNNNMKLNMTNIFLKKSKYFLTLDRYNNIDDKKQVINYINEHYDSKINEKNINYVGLKGNVMIYSIFIDNKKDLCNGNLNDYSNSNDYSWKTFFDINFDNNSNNSNNYEDILKNKKYNLHISKSFISEHKKQRLSLEELYFSLKNHIRIK